jgi:RNA polymerase sigma factor (sigma-70 family)
MLHKEKSRGNSVDLEDVIEIIPDSKSDILSKLIFDESYEEVKEAVKALSYDLRSVVRLFLIDGCSHSEIAETLGITEVASRSRLKRAKREIRKRLKGGIDGK